MVPTPTKKLPIPRGREGKRVEGEVGRNFRLTSNTLEQYSGYPLKLHFQIPCVFPVQLHIFPVPIYVICDYYIDKTDLADLSCFKIIWIFSWQISKYLLN